MMRFSSIKFLALVLPLMMVPACAERAEYYSEQFAVSITVPENWFLGENENEKTISLKIGDSIDTSQSILLIIDSTDQENDSEIVQALEKSMQEGVFSSYIEGLEVIHEEIPHKVDHRSHLMAQSCMVHINQPELPSELMELNNEQLNAFALPIASRFSLIKSNTRNVLAVSTWMGSCTGEVQRIRHFRLTQTEQGILQSVVLHEAETLGNGGE